MLDKIRKPIDKEIELLEEKFKTLIKSDIQLINEIFTHIISTKGKRVRPIILFLSSGIKGTPSEKSYQAALIVELLHTATLIHDDVVDSSEMRRGIPSINSIWENKISVLIGDYLFAEVLNILTDIGDPKFTQIISDVTKQMSLGELLQIEHAKDFEMDEEIYFRLITNKTASLIAASCELGALSSNPDDAGHAENMRIFGESLGIAFQIKDDLLDYLGEEQSLGKPIGQDIVENVITLPVLYSLKNANSSNRDKLFSILQNGQEENLGTLIDIIHDSGGIDYANHKADQFIKKAQECLDIYPDSEHKRSLETLSKYITSRER